MSETIAIIALILSILGFLLSYRNQREQRHAKIVTEYFALLQKIKNIHSRLIPIKMHIHSLGTELMSMSDPNVKNDLIIELATVIEGYEKQEANINKIKSKIESYEISDFEMSSKELMTLRVINPQLDRIEEGYEEFESVVLGFQKFVRDQKELQN